MPLTTLHSLGEAGPLPALAENAQLFKPAKECTQESAP